MRVGEDALRPTGGVHMGNIEVLSRATLLPIRSRTLEFPMLRGTISLQLLVACRSSPSTRSMWLDLGPFPEVQPSRGSFDNRQQEIFAIHCVNCSLALWAVAFSGVAQSDATDHAVGVDRGAQLTITATPSRPANISGASTSPLFL